MLHASLRLSGGSYSMTVPLAYVEQNHLNAGSRPAIEIVAEPTARSTRTRSSRLTGHRAKPDLWNGPLTPWCKKC